MPWEIAFDPSDLADVVRGSQGRNPWARAIKRITGADWVGVDERGAMLAFDLDPITDYSLPDGALREFLRWMAGDDLVSLPSPFVLGAAR